MKKMIENGFIKRRINMRDYKFCMYCLDYFWFLYSCFLRCFGKGDVFK